ncbi:MAG: hypothetical protein ACYC0B_09445, partial [Gemmatimonadaceae bacterium]
LRAMSAVEREIAESDTPELIRRLRTNRLKTVREARDALIFAHGMAMRLGTKVYVAPGEVEDFDFTTCVGAADTLVFSGVQLKEWPPEDLNPQFPFENLAAQLEALPKSDAVLAVRLNRRATVPVEALDAVRVRFAELWYFWATDPSGSEWMLHGDSLRAPGSWAFSYPR